MLGSFWDYSGIMLESFCLRTTLLHMIDKTNEQRLDRRLTSLNVVAGASVQTRESVPQPVYMRGLACSMENSWG